MGRDLTHKCCCWVLRLILVVDKILFRVTQAVAADALKSLGERGANVIPAHPTTFTDRLPQKGLGLKPHLARCVFPEEPLGPVKQGVFLCPQQWDLLPSYDESPPHGKHWVMCGYCQHTSKY